MGHDRQLFFLTLVLLVGAGAWLFSFYKAGIMEQNWLQRLLRESDVSDIGVGTHIVVFLLIVAFALLIYFADRIVYYSAMLTIVCLLDIWSIYLIRSRISSSLIAAESREEDPHRQAGLSVLRHYYLELPWPQRVTTQMFANFVAFSFGFGFNAIFRELSPSAEHSVLSNHRGQSLKLGSAGVLASNDG